MKKLFFAFTFFPLIVFGQKQGDNWYFGDHAGINFSNGSPVTLNDGLTPNGTEGTAVMSDSAGSLLFYTDGLQLWNRNQMLMPNGDSLAGNISSTQSSLIIPMPGSSRYFYVFTTDDFLHNLANGLRYSVVDLCLDNGLGDVISNQKNILLVNTVAEKLTGVRHSNGVDYWIITHLYFSDAFYSYHISSTGISAPVISHIGSIHPNPNAGSSYSAALGQLKASPNGQKLVIVNGNGSSIAEYFDFNNSTGVVSNCVNIQANSNWNYYGASFSPDNSKIYIACWLNGNGIYQFDLNAGGGDPSAVFASKTLIDQSYNFLGLQLANNGKIYVARSPFGTTTFLDVINDPNNAGLSCNYVKNAVNLNGHLCGSGFPNFVDSYDYSNTIFNCQTGVDDIQPINQISLYPNPANNSINIICNNANESEVTIFDAASR
ncbi:MAG TPA: hypothetical protein PLG57_11920, partial [Bacteroidia bacterium]|nr:hypothetical protein [Bacteroidia bacterium]